MDYFFPRAFFQYLLGYFRQKTLKIDPPTQLLLLLLERNLNPKAACLKRREEEKAEDGPKIPQHHMLQQAPYPALPVRDFEFANDD